ncbi:hypothetical protein HRR78_008363 [Exophiala dermatitidis]|nr:hypothetical protein HRR75_006988 [Exophiala dermatitidis]KAJ4537931.1 hypothetical protein HRR78_008363 [Exophiala dermatitidis]
MAQSSAVNEQHASEYSHRPRLPSFSNFLSGAGRSDLNLALPRPAFSRPNINATHHETSPQNGVHATQYTPTAGPPAASPGFNPRPHDQHPEPSRPPFWSYPTPAHSDRSAVSTNTVPPVPPVDRTYSRVVVREEVIPGRGLCQIYDDGTVGQRMSDSDAFNPKWGTTKAGKPRKRLGQACNTCREKKIKCDPSVPKCAQCQKYGRECKFEIGPRSGQKRSGSVPSAYSPSYSSPTEHTSAGLFDRRESTASTEFKGQESPLSKPANRSSLPLESLLSPASDNESTRNHRREDRKPPSKRARYSASPRPVSEGSLSDCVILESQTSSTAQWNSTPPFSWQTDPYQLHRGLTLYYVGKYFAHVDSAAYCTLPKKKFTHWVENCTSKSLEDKMMLYAILALGTVFVRQPTSEVHRATFLRIVHDAVLKCGDRLSLQLVQTRLILASLALSQGEYNRAWDSCGAALRTAFGLGYNTEEGVRVVGNPQTFDLGLDATALVECRRRTFWAAYVMDCFGSGGAAYASSMYGPECHLRLPCDEAAYESGNIPAAAFDLTTSSSAEVEANELSTQIRHVGLLGYLVQMAKIFREVVSRISRPGAQSESDYCTALESFHQETMTKLQTWYTHLRTHLRRASTDSSGTETFNGLHILYHYTALLLHRHVRHTEISPRQINTHVQGAYGHARQMLEIVQRLSNNNNRSNTNKKKSSSSSNDKIGSSSHNNKSNQERESALLRFTTTSPFSAYAITSALDAITAAGLLSEVMDHKSRTMSLISSGLEALEGLMEFWHSAHQQRDMIKQRLKALLNASQKASDHNGAFYFSNPMQSPFGLDQDIVYGLPRMRYFQALGWDDKIQRGEFHQLDQQ